MKLKRWLVAPVALATTTLAMPNAAWAEGAVSAADAAETATLLKAAAVARDSSDFATCRDKANIAWQKFHHAQIAGLLGLCQVELGEYKEGATHLTDFLNSATNVSEGSKADARAALVKAKVHLAEVSLSCTPPGVELLVDGQSVGVAPITVFVDPGDHRIEARHEGYEPGTQTKSLLASTTVKIDIVLNPVGPATVGERGHKPVWPYIVGGVVAAAGLGVGIAGAVLAQDKSSDRKNLAASSTCKPVSAVCLTQGNDLAKKNGNFETMETTGFIVGGAALVGTLIYLVVPAPRKNPTAGRLHFVPVINPTGSGLWLDGSF